MPQWHQKSYSTMSILPILELVLGSIPILPPSCSFVCVSDLRPSCETCATRDFSTHLFLYVLHVHDEPGARVQDVRGHRPKRYTISGRALCRASMLAAAVCGKRKTSPITAC